MAVRRWFGPIVASLALVASLGASSTPVSATVGQPAAASPTPAPPTSLPAMAQVSVGRDSACGLSNAGKVLCWGSNQYGQLGNGTTVDSSLPRPVETTGTALAGKTVTQVAAGDIFACALATDHSISCWGADGIGQLGHGDDPAGMSTVPVAVTTAGTPLAGHTVVGLSAGAAFACARTSVGSVACWGDGSSGQLGTGSTSSVAVPTAVHLGVLGGKAVTTMDGAYNQACFGTADGTVACTGANGEGQLGDGTLTSRSTPVLVSKTGGLAGKTVTRISTGDSVTCAVDSDGTAACWGSGALGNAGTTSSATPVAVTKTGTALEAKSITQISIGDGSACATAADGSVGCWGSDGVGQLGDGSNTDQTTAVAATTVGTPLAGKTVTSVELGGTTACARASDGSLACWGNNDYGEGGHGGTSLQSAPGSFVPGTLAGHHIRQIVAGSEITCALTDADTIACWGNNRNHGLGNLSSAQQFTPQDVDLADSSLNGIPIAKITVGGGGGCALGTNHALACWGQNDHGQVGDGSTFDAVGPGLIQRFGTPLAGKTIIDVASGFQHTCALTSDDIVACWGRNDHGQLGDGTTNDAHAAVAVTGTLPAGMTSLGAGIDHTCVVGAASAISCWGANDRGQLGDGNTNAASGAVAVVTDQTELQGKTVSQLSVGGSHTCALSTDGLINCWGSNDFGQLGSETGSSSLPVPVLTPGTPLLGPTVTEIDAGEDYTCALATGGVAACWGYDSVGQLGSAPPGNQTRPVGVQIAGSPLAGKTLVHISAGAGHTCALASDETVGCWGDNAYGEIGNGLAGRSNLALAVGPVAPITAPSAPAVSVAAPISGAVRLTWAVPLGTGGSPITGYVVTPSVGATALAPRTFDSTATSQTITGLTNGTGYTFVVAAKNAVGTGDPSSPTAVVTPNLPYRPFASADAFVARQLLDFAGSAGTVAGRVPAAAAITNGTALPADYISTEIHGTYFAGNVAGVARLYWAYFGRIPDYGGVTYWSAKHRSGTSLARISQGFALSHEFLVKYGSLSNEAFVRRIYTDVLGRDADAGGVAHWTGLLNSGTTRGQVMVNFSESNEYQRKKAADVDIVMAYAGMLHRGPAAGELTTGEGRSLTATIDAIRLSAAYKTRVGA